MAVLHSLADARLQEGNCFCALGQCFDALAAEQFRDSRKAGDVNIFNEVDEFGEPNGRLVCM